MLSPDQADVRLLVLYHGQRAKRYALCRGDERPRLKGIRASEGLVEGFTKWYEVKLLVYFERYDTAHAAIQREKNVKHWARKWKIELIQKMNPEWRDLYEDVVK